MSKKLLKERKFNLGIVESYKKIAEQDSPILGSFTVKGMTVENMVSQNKTKYSKDVWQQPTAFGQGGKFLDENGKLKPATLFGSVDHPIDSRAELLLQEAAIAWHDVKRNDNGSWDGAAHILNNPQGRIVKTFLDYAKQFGGGDLLGVSSRALGESVLSEANGEQVEAIVPNSFELMSFDFVYNPSFQTAVAHLNESTKSFKKNILVESVRNLAKDDEDHAEVYKNFADKIETINKELSDMPDKKFAFESHAVDKAKETYFKELREQEKKLHDAIYELENMTDEEFAKENDESRSKMLTYIKKEYKEVLTELESLESDKQTKMESKKIKKENMSRLQSIYYDLADYFPEEAPEDMTDEELEELEACAIKELKSHKRSDLNDPEYLADIAMDIFDACQPQTESKMESKNKTEEVIIEAEEAKKVIAEDEEAKELDKEELEDTAEEMAEELSDEKEEELEIEAEEELEIEAEEEMGQDDLAAVKEELSLLKDMIQELRDFLIPIEAPELEIEDMPEQDEEMADEEMADDQAEELKGMEEEDLEELSDEELEFLANLDL
jgi:hypothetical protein